METMITLALLAWGWFFPMTVVMQDAPDPHPWIYATNTPFADYSWCAIFIYPLWYESSPEQQQRVITHEIGHCLGLDHITAKGLMDPGADSELTAADRAEFRRVHPVLTPRGRAASLASE